MNIGIMSMQRVINYGSYLQAHGLKSVLESMGHQVQFVDYQIEPPLVQESVPSSGKKYCTKAVNAAKMLSPHYRQWRRDQIRSNQTCTEFHHTFLNSYLPVLGVTEQRNERPELDALVIGSDEVFNCTQANQMVGYSRELFGADNHARKLISYAASFGSTTLEKLKKYGIQDEVADYLSAFDGLSLRDENSLDIVSTLCGIQGSYNIDPVLLYDFPEVDSISVDLKDYIVVYAYAGRIKDEEAEVIRKFAHEKNKKLISLGYWQTFCDDYVAASPLEVLAYIRNADYVITDTFHGSVFSIKYQKKFGTIVRSSNQQKLMDLLNQFDLGNHQITQLDQLPAVVEQDIDRAHVLDLLHQKQALAMKYLCEKLPQEG